MAKAINDLPAGISISIPNALFSKPENRIIFQQGNENGPFLSNGHWLLFGSMLTARQVGSQLDFTEVMKKACKISGQPMPVYGDKEIKGWSYQNTMPKAQNYPVNKTYDLGRVIPEGGVFIPLKMREGTIRGGWYIKLYADMDRPWAYFNRNEMKLGLRSHEAEQRKEEIKDNRFCRPSDLFHSLHLSYLLAILKFNGLVWLKLPDSRHSLNEDFYPEWINQMQIEPMLITQDHNIYGERVFGAIMGAKE